ncbi:MAG: GFA family protein [Hydrogenophaga sp.]|nr:GFA family protein [Hydrogenophaga sp.]MDO9505463.1 GFA family protein [Hydrogenophaga sp.]
MSFVLEGGCLCGAVRFHVKQAPLRTLVCHCTFCQKMTGSSFYANSVFPMEAVAFNDCEVRKFEHTSDSSGKKICVEFCATCGTTVGLTFERWPSLRAVSRGCFDNPNEVEVGANLWTRSAQSGVALPAEIDCFAKSRLNLEGQPEQPRKYSQPVMAGGDA